MANGTFTYGYGSNPAIDAPRFLVADTVEEGHIFADEEIMMTANLISPMLAIVPTGGGQTSFSGVPASYRFTAALMLEALAGNKARLASALKILDITVDTTKAAAALRDTAKTLRDSEINDGSFAIAEQCTDQFSARERLWKQLVRLQNG
jgi:hypothetical protein